MAGATLRILTRGLLLAVVALLIPACGGGGGDGAAAPPNLLDPSFNPGGMFPVQLFKNGSITAAARQPDGKLLFVGYADGPANANLAVVQVRSDGTLDASMLVPVSSGDDFAAGVAVQPDGKIVVALQTPLGFTVARFKALLWTFDDTFDDDGIASLSLSGSDSVAAVALQPDGRIVVAGTSDGDFAVVRFNSDGTLDLTFDTDGRVTTPVGAGVDKANALAIQPDGKIVVAGMANNGVANHIAVVRYNANGSLDTGFAGDGILSTTVGSTSNGAGVALQADGRIVVCGSATVATDVEVAVVRYNTNGSLDAAFGTAGLVTLPVLGEVDFANAVMVQPDGRIVLAGGAQNATNLDFAVLRLLSNGMPDPAFNATGRTVTAIPQNSEFAFAALLEPDGRIVVAGDTTGPQGPESAILRYRTDGTLDPDFRPAGILTTSLGAGYDKANAVAVQADGKIVVAGEADQVDYGQDSRFGLARYNADGTLDPTFGTGGTVTTDSNSGADAVNALAIQPDGKILAGGSTYGAGPHFATLFRYTSAGVLDPGFGTGGKVVLFSEVFPILSLALQPDGKILAALDGSVFVVLRFDSAGILDPTFGTGGKATASLGASSAAKALALQPDGKIVLTGRSGASPIDCSMAVVRLLSNGTVDAAFGSAGWIVQPGTQPMTSGSGVLIQPDGRILVSVNSQHQTDLWSTVEVRRYSALGVPDASFGTAGAAIHQLGSDFTTVSGMALQPDGKIVLGGNALGEPAPCMVARMNADGSRDAGFGVNGVTLFRPAMPSGTVNALALQSDGRIIAVGHTYSSSGYWSFMVARLAP